ncbi:hypothetical protein [Ruegeria atlantica]|uniref:hypothetical protein n=1 Tax=Ruegeria atlantica TaxID=81569 RepID=UPI00249473A4|nr:hypothetical protein [Ruegeria atlantica]
MLSTWDAGAYAAYLARAGADFGDKTATLRCSAAGRAEVAERAEAAVFMARIRDGGTEDDPLLTIAPANVDIAIAAATTKDRITAVGLSARGRAFIGDHGTDRYGRTLSPAIIGATVPALTEHYQVMGMRV